MLLSLALVATVVGAMDAFVGSEWDLLAVFMLSLTLQSMVWLRQRSTRLDVSVRADLVHWMEHESQRTGEPVEDLIDRAVAWHQHGLYPPRSAAGR